NRRHGWLPQARDLGPRQYRVGQHSHQYHQARDRDETKDGGHAYVRALLRVAGIDAGALDTDKDEHGDEDRGPDLLEEARHRHPLAAPKIRGKEVSLE